MCGLTKNILYWIWIGLGCSFDDRVGSAAAHGQNGRVQFATIVPCCTPTNAAALASIAPFLQKNPVIFQIRGGAFPLNSNSCTLWMAQFFQCRALPHFLPAAPQAARFFPAGQASIINERAATLKGAFRGGQNWLAEHARILGLPWPIWRRQNWFHFGTAYFWQFYCGRRFSGFPAGKCF